MRKKDFLLLLWMLLLNTSTRALAQVQQGDLSTALQDFGRLDNSQKNMILSSVGMPSSTSFTLSKIVACVIFSSIGFIAFSYGRKLENYKALGLGLALMIYPYFLTNTFWLYVVGSLLCLALYFWRD